jgi:hypothetical protein
MPRQIQHGGSMKKIQSLTPTITSPETMVENCQFQLVSGHGMTIMDTLMIVPKDTFVLFLSGSGYDMNPLPSFNSLLLTNSYPSIDAYYKNVFDNFFSPGVPERSLFPYPSSQIYTPGDILHDTFLQMYSSQRGNGQFINYYGYLTLPITETKPTYNSANKSFAYSYYYARIPYVLYLIKEYTNGNIPQTIFAEAKLKPERKKEWDRLATFDDYYELSHEFLKNTPDEWRLSDWFNNPRVIMESFINIREASHPNNKYMYETPTEKTTLSQLLSNYTNEAIGSSKQYRFVVVMACRGPNVDIDSIHSVSRANQLKFANLEPSALTDATPSQRLARRASFSAKQLSDTCPVGAQASSMNLASVKKAMEDIAPFIKQYSGTQLAFLRRIYQSFFRLPRKKARSLKKGELLEYREIAYIGPFVKAINLSLKPFPLLESEDPRQAERKRRFETVVKTFHTMIRAYAIGTLQNIPIAPKNTLGEHIVKQALDPESITNPHMKYIFGKIKEEERKNITSGIKNRLLNPNALAAAANGPVANYRSNQTRRANIGSTPNLPQGNRRRNQTRRIQ